MIILKLGGSVITDKSKDFTMAQETLDRISKEIAEAGVKDLIIVHGGGSFGHPLAYKYHIQEGYTDESQRMGFALTQQAMETLDGYVIAALLKAEIPAIPIQPSAFTMMEQGTIKSADLSIVEKAVHLSLGNAVTVGLVPVLYGVPALDTKKGFSILSGDEIIHYLAERFKPERVIFVSDVDGILDDDPKINPDAKVLPEITESNFNEIHFNNLKNDVTGGMKRKVQELLKLAKLGASSQVINGNVPGNVKKALQGETVGTVVK